MGTLRTFLTDPLRFNRSEPRDLREAGEMFKITEQWANRQPGIGLWTEPTLTSPWVNYNAGFREARLRFEGDLVRVEGLVSSNAVAIAAANVYIFNWPNGYAPDEAYVVHSIGAHAGGQALARLTADSTGLLFEQFPGVAFPVTVSFLAINFTFSTTPTPLK